MITIAMVEKMMAHNYHFLTCCIYKPSIKNSCRIYNNYKEIDNNMYKHFQLKLTNKWIIRCSRKWLLIWTEWMEKCTSKR